MKHYTPLSVVIIFSMLLFACGDDSAEASSSCSNDMTCGVFELVNEEREAAGVAPLDFSGELQLAAQLHADDMLENGYFSHQSQDGRSFATRATEAGYSGSPGGENIATGQTSPAQVMNSWMNSPGHRGNILNEGYDELGVGFAGNYWVQVFGRQR